MAPKRPNPKEEEEHPPANSTTEEEDSSSDASSSEDEKKEKEKVKEKTPKPSSPPPKKPETTTTATTTTPKPQSSSSSESEESEGSDSDESEPEKAQIKPIATKPMEETPKTTKPRSKPAATATAAKSTVKRAIENDDDKKDPKKAKKGSSSEPEEDSKQVTADPKKLLFQRLWSEDDEIAVLKGYIEYTEKNGADPMTDMNAFLDYIKDSLHFDVTKSQLNDKIRRLKKKYENNLGRGKKGKDPTFSKPHEEKAYEWSKKVWGGGEGVESSAAAKFNGKTRTPRAKAAPTPKFAEFVSSPERKQTKVKKTDEIKVESQSEDQVVLFDKNVASTGDMNEYVINHGLELVDGSKKAELEERWRKLQLGQLELFVERSKLIYDQSKLVLEAAKAVN